MNKNKIEEILKKVTPPAEVDQNKKHELRRELLNSKHFEKNGISKILVEWKYLLAGISAAAIILIIFLKSDETVTIESLRHKANAYYASLVPESQFASFENDVAVFGTNQNEVKLKVDQIFDPISNNIRINVFNEKRIEKLDELITKDGKLYRSENPKIKTVGTVSPLSQSKMQVFVFDDSSNVPPDLLLLKRDDNLEGHFSHLSQNGYLIYQRPVKISGEIPSYSTKPFYQEVPREIDIDKYFRTNPLELLDEINKSDSAVYIGSSYDELSFEEVQLIQLTSEIDKDLVKAYQIVLSKVDSLSNFSVRLNAHDTISKMQIDPELKWSSVDADSLKSYKELKTISFAAHTGKVTKVDFAIIKGDKKIKLSEIRFINQISIPIDSSNFDPQKHGLVFVGNRN